MWCVARNTPYTGLNVWVATKDTLAALSVKWQVAQAGLVDAAVEMALDDESELARRAQERTPAKGRRGKLAGKLRKYYVKQVECESDDEPEWRPKCERDANRDAGGEEKKRTEDGREV